MHTHGKLVLVECHSSLHVLFPVFYMLRSHSLIGPQEHGCKDLGYLPTVLVCGAQFWNWTKGSSPALFLKLLITRRVGEQTLHPLSVIW